MKKYIKLPEIIEIEYFKSLPTTPEIDKSFSDYFQEEKKKKTNLKLSKRAKYNKDTLPKD